MCNFPSGDLHVPIKEPEAASVEEPPKWLQMHQIHPQTVDGRVDPATKWWQSFVFTRPFLSGVGNHTTSAQMLTDVCVFHHRFF